VTAAQGGSATPPTTAKGEIWLAGASKTGPWLLAVDRPAVAAELGQASVTPHTGPGAATFVFATLGDLYGALDRVYRLGVSLPDAPLSRFCKAITGLPRTTEAERLLVQRVSQNVFREALLAYRGGRCPRTGHRSRAAARLAQSSLGQLRDRRTSPRCPQRSAAIALWDAAFDALVSFADDGAVLQAKGLSEGTRVALGLEPERKLAGLTAGHKENLKWHSLPSRFRPAVGVAHAHC
jgi:hypothetical protein